MRIFSGLLLLIAFQAGAEYRMFLLEIQSPDGTEKKQIKSQLDPDQYRGYHPLKAGETISYIDTWMCKGNTSFKEPCPNPREASNEPPP